MVRQSVEELLQELFALQAQCIQAIMTQAQTHPPAPVQPPVNNDEARTLAVRRVT